MLRRLSRVFGWILVLSAALVVALGLLTPAQAVWANDGTVLYVDADATGAATGLSWTNAYTNVQDALAFTHSNSTTDYDIWIAAGIYYPDVGGGLRDNDPRAFFGIAYNNVKLYGGFDPGAGADTWDERDWETHSTILSGDLQQDDANANGVVTATAGISGTNALHVLYLDGATNEAITGDTVIDGVIITAGWTNTAGSGGGLYCDGGGNGNVCSPTLANVTFSGNWAYDNGGGMYNRGNCGTSSPMLTNVTFSGNRVYDGCGGGMYNDGRDGGTSSPTLTHVTFTGNRADMVNGNAACGGGMYNDGTSSGTSSPTLTHVTFSGNRADSGGGMYNDGCSGTSSPTLTNVTFSGNLADHDGGAMVNNGYSGISSPTLINVTFSGNHAAYYGGGIYNESCTPVLTNTILWGNHASAVPHHDDDPGPGHQIYNSDAGVSLSYTLVQSRTGESDIVGTVTYGDGILTTDPLFVAPITATVAPTTTGNYRLQLGSPAVDAGTQIGCPATDLDGNSRPDDGDADGTADCDMGAYEAQRLYVNVAAEGEGTGLSWTDAYTNVQDVLALTNVHGEADYEVWVAEGVYYPDVGGAAIADTETMSFTLRYDNVRLYGGFAGNETTRDARDWVAHRTTLSGDLEQDDTGMSWLTNAMHILYLDGVTHEAITGDTVIDGFTIAAGQANGEFDTVAVYGGGLYCDGHGAGNGCSPSLTHVTFSSNVAVYDGGAVFLNGASGGNSSPMLTNVTFSGNEASDGGAVFLDGSSGGNSSPMFANVIFSGNLADARGGAICLDGTFGGISSPTLTNVTFSGNWAGIKSYPGAGGAMFLDGTSEGTCSPTLVNTVLWGNQASAASDPGHQMVIIDATPSLSYTLVQSSTDDIVISGTSTIDYGPVILTADPLFVTPIAASGAPTTTGNYHLQAGSPAIDAGTNTGCLSTDLDGLPRPIDGDGDGTAICDLGAYEVFRLYVAASAAGTATGLSWTDAYTNVQDALALADAHAGIDYEIWVAEGVYYPDVGGDAIADTATMSFAVRHNNIKLYGGFAGTETTRDQRDWEAHPTILSGDLQQDDANVNDVVTATSGISGTNATHVLYLDGVTNEPLTGETVIDGFIITAGKTPGSGVGDSGGGLYCDGGDGGECSPTLADVTFSGNWAHNGGGMFNDGSDGTSSPSLTNVTFSGNQAGYHGGGIYNHGASGTSNPSLTNVTFSGNQAGSHGGGMFSYGNQGISSPSLTNVLFSGNCAGYGGGMGNDGSSSGISSPSLTNVTFSGNQADYWGGGIYNYGAGGTCSPVLTNVILWGNAAGNEGHQMYNDRATPSLGYTLVQSRTNDMHNADGSIAYGAGIITTDPLFVDPIIATLAPTTTGDYHIQLGSPAIDAGDPTTCPTTDLDGLPRPNDGDGNGTATCDMGAYEAGTMVCGVVTDTYTFSNHAGLTIGVTTPGENLACLYVDEMGLDHPAATDAEGTGTGRYWQIRAVQSDKTTPATGFTAVLTLPHALSTPADASVCRYTEGSWVCGQSGYDATFVWLAGITAFSDWSVGQTGDGATATTVASLTARNRVARLVLPLLLALGVGGVLHRRRRRV